MYSLQDIFILLIEILCVILYLFIMYVIDFSKSSSMKSQFIGQSWILCCFDLGWLFFSIVLRILREMGISVGWAYSIFIITKISLGAHQLTMIWINWSRFQILNNAMRKSEVSNSLTSSQRHKAVLLFFTPSFFWSLFRVVIVFIDGWPDLNYTWPDKTLMFVGFAEI
ncbi:unnamed protein product, partial [Mesorhabditis belari]|uniref:Uncharacterized protein n=1 Tax=Mesorhabditis belari TaxID=2138241 RepID=A0AAF3FFV9_9BILA